MFAKKLFNLYCYLMSRRGRNYHDGCGSPGDFKQTNKPLGSLAGWWEGLGATRGVWGSPVASRLPSR